MKRIVVLTTSFPRDAGDAAGHFVETAARELARDAIVHVVCGRRRAAVERRGPLHVHAVGGGSLFAWPGAMARLRQAPWRAAGAASFAAGARLRLLQIGRVDRVIAHWMLPSVWPVLVGFDDVPIEAVAHGADVRALCSLPSPARQRVALWLLGRLSSIQFVASSLEQQLKAALDSTLAARLDDISFIQPCSLSVPPRADGVRTRVRDELGVRAGQRIVAVAGRLVAQKRVSLALEAARSVDAHVVIVGDGPEERRLQALAARLSLRATFMGQLTRERALDVIASCDALWSCSATEAAPSVIREARALDVPVVATAAGDVERWAQSDDRLVVAEASPAAIALATRALWR